MSSALCQSCGLKNTTSDMKSKEAHDQMTKEAIIHLDYLNNAMALHFNLKEDVQRKLQVIKLPCLLCKCLLLVNEVIVLIFIFSIIPITS